MDEMDEKRFEDARRRYPLGCIEVWIKDEQGGESLWHVIDGSTLQSSQSLPPYQTLMQVWQTRAQPGQYTWKFAPKRGDDPVAVGKFKVEGDDIVARQVSQYADMVKSVIGGIGDDITDIFDRKLSSDDWEFKITWVFVSEDRSFASVVAPEGAGWSLDRWGASSGAVVFLWRRKLDKAEPPGEDTGS